MKVRDLMSGEVVTLGARDVLVTADEIMGLRRFRHMPVVEDGKVVGLVSRKDIVRASLPAGASRAEQLVHQASVRVADVMRRDVVTVGPDLDLADAAAILADRKIGCLPVVGAAGEVVGMLTEADFVRMVQALLVHAEQTDPAFVDGLKARLRG